MKNVEEISREHGINRATFYQWRNSKGGMQAGELKRLKELAEENSCLKRIYFNLRSALALSPILSAQRTNILQTRLKKIPYI